MFFVEFNDGLNSIVVQNIFDSSVYQKNYTLKNSSSFADPVVGLTFDGEGKASVTYLTGTETAILQTNTTIYFP